MKSSGTSGQFEIARKIKKSGQFLTGLILLKHLDKSKLVRTDLKVLGQFSRLNAQKLSGKQCLPDAEVSASVILHKGIDNSRESFAEIKNK